MLECDLATGSMTCLSIYLSNAGNASKLMIIGSCGFCRVMRCISAAYVGMLKLTTDKHEALRGLSATAELLVTMGSRGTLVFTDQLSYPRPQELLTVNLNPRKLTL